MGVLHLNGAPLLFGGTALHFGTAETATLISNAFTVQNRSASEMAPESITFAVDPTTLNTPLSLSGPSGAEDYDPRLVEPTFVWDFGEGAAFTSNTNSANYNSRYGMGPVAQHTYRSAWSGTVRLDIYMPGGGHWYSTLSVTVNAWTGTTITVGPTGRDYTAFDTALTNALGTETGQTEIVLDRGETFSFSGRALGDSTANRFNNLTIRAASGAGANPIINWNGQLNINESASAVADGTKTLILQNIDARGGWDSTTNVGGTTEFINMINPTTTPNQLLIDGGSADGFAFGAYIDHNVGTLMALNLILNDTSWNDYRYGQINSFKLSSIICTGSNITSDPAARVHDGAHNGGWVLRCDTPLLILSQNNWHCRQGWFASEGEIDYQGTRYNADGRADSECYISENYFEHGFSALSLGATDNADQTTNKALVVEGNVLVGGWNTNSFIQSKIGGAHYRSNLFVLPATTYQKFSPTAVLAFEGAGPAGNLSAPIRIYNNTFRNIRTSGSLSVYGTSGSTFTDIATPANNVMSQPNLGTPDDADSPLINSGTVLMQPVEGGFREVGGTYTRGTDDVTPQDIIYSFAPDTGSAAIDDATTGLVAPLDQTRAERGATPSRGWREPA